MRYITLLEFQAGLEATITPPSSYLEKTNGSLEAHACHLKIDNDGFMVSPKPVEPGQKKVLLLGGSSIENLYIPENQRVMTQLEDQCTKQSKNIKVYNAAISNAHLLHLTNILLNKGIGLRPDCVVIYLTPGLDVMANSVDNTFWNPTGNMTPIRKANKETVLEFLSAFPNKDDYADECRLLSSIQDICTNFGIQLFIATWPIYGAYDAFMKKAQPNRAAFEEEQQQTINLNAAVREHCAARKIGLIDLERQFANLDHHLYFYDWNHTSVQGCELIAKMTCDVIAPHI